jgi:HAD superfamily hydrolase (TIGR01509 family)
VPAAPRNGRPPAAVFFDLDGLLLDTETVWSKAEAELFARHGRTFGPAEKRRLIGTSGAKAASLIEEMLDLPGQGAALSAAIRDLVWEALEEGAPAQPGAVELVAELSERGVPIGVASNSPRAIVDRAIAYSALNVEFGVVLGGDDVPNPKPAPDVYLAAARALGAEPRDAVALEDSPPGVASARGAGMHVIGVPSFPGVTLEEAHVVAESLHDPVVRAAVGLPARERDRDRDR